ncbi:hypothetical protein M5K25_023960 [Dendrobium thyrsiflorum]|uniref:Uncharacterized protein n=1 Tax=Dendrobium thyrsiflorum TaxID=117978 RepID=A0ABD0U142_DENTH
MQQKSFPNIFIDWIKACIENVHYSICINDTLEGLKTRSFSIFLSNCIVLDDLSNQFERAILMNSHSTITIRNHHFSQLLSADDFLPPINCQDNWHFPAASCDIISAMLISYEFVDNILWLGSNKPHFRLFVNSYYSDLPLEPWSKFIWHKKYSLRYSLDIVGGLKTVDALIS